LRFTDFPTVAEAIKGGSLQATFLILPLAMKLREQGIPIKVVYLEHREGSTVIVATHSPARTLSDLRRKPFAIRGRYRNKYLVIHKLLEDEGRHRERCGSWNWPCATALGVGERGH
jgi:NitT/TauT family transport system substrate-binding protein